MFIFDKISWVMLLNLFTEKQKKIQFNSQGFNFNFAAFKRATG